MTRLFTLALLLALAGGCTKAPTMAGGKSVGHWVAALKDPDPRQRKKAVTKLGNVGTADAAALPALIEALKDTEPEVRGEAVLALVKFGPAAKSAVPALTEVEHNDPEPQIRDHAARALQRIQAK